MIGSVIIDGIDIYSQYGIFVIYQGLNELLEFPETKDPDKNDWAEEDGIEVDLSEIYFNSKSFKVKFGGNISGDIDGFINMLTQPGVRECNFVYVGLQKTLRVVSVPDYTKITLPLFTIEFSEDNPLIIQSDPIYINTNTGFKIKDIDFSTYGVSILEGSIDEITKPFPLKKNLSVSIGTKSGQKYNSGRVKFTSKDVKLNCLMKSQSKSDFQANYNALFSLLVSSGIKTFSYNSQSYACYYKSMSVSEFDISNDKFWLKFSLNFVFTKQL